jgi:hypothetical protein
VNFKYEVFISYNKDDLAWAQAVHDGLAAGQPAGALPHFFAPESLRSGDHWEEQVEQALRSSRHLVVLWSDKAKSSDWVSRELVTFFNVARPQADPTRRMLFVNLQGANTAFTQLQKLALAPIQKAYAESRAASPAEIAQLMLKLRQGLDPAMRPLRVPLVVLAMTRGEFDGLDPKRRLWIESDLHVRSARLAGLYGATRGLWCPFGREQPVQEVLDEAAQIIDKAVKNRRCEWVPPADDFWDDKAAAKTYIDNTFRTGELSLLLIDPASLSHPDIFERLMLFQHSLASPTTVIATLAPFGVPRRLLGLKAALRLRATPYFDDYLMPAVPPERRVAAQCTWNAVDADDIGRQLLMAAAHLGGEPPGAPRPQFLQHGGGG